MPLRLSTFSRTFKFSFKARTSRGLMKEKISWFIRVEDDRAPAVYGVGECGPLPGLSADYSETYGQTLSDLAEAITRAAIPPDNAQQALSFVAPDYPSIIFGMETALRDFLNGGRRVIFRNSFLEGTPIPINGLVWMGDTDFMMDQINKKIEQGFTCIKLKVGGLDFDRECDILNYIRKRYFRKNITIRLDANGAFKSDDVLYKLGEMQRFNVHSIEQPIRPGLEEMEELCRKSPIPVAFDEELIGIFSGTEKEKLLQKLRPQYIVLKPTLHGGLRGSHEWIGIARNLGIGWWLTSALESSVGLNAICQFAAEYNTAIPQGLGTGGIYENNIPSPLKVRNGEIFHDTTESWADIT